MDKDSIKKIAEEFTSQTFGNDIPSNLCFSTCFSFSILLDTKQVKHSISCGDYSPNDKSTPHIWLTLDDDVTILDPTIRQFDASVDSVYIGKLTENEVTKYYVPGNGTFKEQFDHLYHTWTAPLLNTQPRTPRPKGFEEKMNLLNVKTASILYRYINTTTNSDDFIRTNKCRRYFSPIFKFLQDKHNANSLFIDSITKLMPHDFNVFSSKALSSN